MHYWHETEHVKNSFVFTLLGMNFKTCTKPSYTSIYPFFEAGKRMNLFTWIWEFSWRYSRFFFSSFFCVGGKNKSNTLSTLIWRKFCLLGNFVEENLRSRRTHEEHCFFSSKCFHSLNKFNKTCFDWQESALPQCLLFAITFLVSSCAPFLNEMKTGNVRGMHTHIMELGTSGTFIQVSVGASMCYSWHISGGVIPRHFTLLWIHRQSYHVANLPSFERFCIRVPGECSAAQEVMHFTFPACLFVIKKKNLFAWAVTAKRKEHL